MNLFRELAYLERYTSNRHEDVKQMPLRERRMLYYAVSELVGLESGPRGE